MVTAAAWVGTGLDALGHFSALNLASSAPARADSALGTGAVGRVLRKLCIGPLTADTCQAGRDGMLTSPSWLPPHFTVNKGQKPPSLHEKTKFSMTMTHCGRGCSGPRPRPAHTRSPARAAASPVPRW